MNKALFLDRDGVIINYIPYLSKPEQVEIPEGAGQALRQWQDAGYLLIIITNQSGVGRGYFSLDDVAQVHAQVFREYQQFEVSFHDVLICPHHPDEACKCRKPSPYLLLQAAKKYNVDLSQSYFIGDAPSDLECAIQAGCHPVLLLTGRGTSTVKQIEKYSIEVTIFHEIYETIKLI
ncbi:HAD family hydrolase [Cronbergia sp. UHCC 0137]|uniref:D-glycero-alpha-D-manno-heptose-1,7-bisphosphate 7-phosphatase n=1 Tax=Cronbergia sp. UHCC 0137 TaxID=3110239 RepID=UPI002B1FBA07|nr:HAD family hydrolase [Cronbergia sp. UHCC 0137]MEA5618352.1 HAD family hydrolase [Cronbergia sp. UHCC 0137]